MEINDQEKELQHKVDQGLPTEDSADTRAYRVVFDALRKEPAFQLPDSFARRVATIASMSTAVRDARNERWLFAGGIVLFLVAFAFALTQIDFSKFSFNPGVGVFTFFSNYAGPLVFGALFVTGLLVAERKLLRGTR